MRPPRPVPPGRASAAASDRSPRSRTPPDPRSRSWTSSRMPARASTRGATAPRSWSRTGRSPHSGYRTSYIPGPTSTDPPAAAAPPGRWTRTGRGRTLHPYLRLTVARNLCRRTGQGQQTPRPDLPKCHRPDQRPGPGTAGAGPPRQAVRDDERSRSRCPLARSCRTTSQTTSRAIPLDRNRPARGAGRTLIAYTGRAGHSHNVRIHQTVSTTHHPFGAPTPRNLMPLPDGPHAPPVHWEDDRA